MSKTKIETDRGPKPVGPYSQAIKANGFMFISGQIPIDPTTNQVTKGTFEEQCRLVLNNIKAILEAGDSSIDEVVKVNIYLKDMESFSELNKIYNEYFESSKPARVCTQAGRLPLDVELEIEVTALYSN